MKTNLPSKSNTVCAFPPSNLRQFLTLLTLLGLSTLNSQLSTLCAQSTAFTYSGRLTDGGSPANGSYDLRLILYTADLGGSQIGPILTNSPTPVSNGLFTATLDFGPDAFTGADRFLDIGARTNGGGAFTPLTPRQKITPTPYAITASNLTGIVSATGLSGTYSSAVTLNNAANSFSGNGTGLTSLNGANLSAGTVTLAKLAANSVDTSKIVDDTIVNADIAGSAGIVDTKLFTISTAGKVANSATTATSANTANAIVARNASGNFTAGAITATSISGDGSALTLSANVGLLNAVQTNTADKYFTGGAQLFLDPGAEATPGLAFNGDVDTGFFRPLANTLALSTSGNERLRVDSSGRVGIGTTSPALRLTLAGSGAFNSVSAAAILLDNTSANGRRWEWHALDNGKIQLADYDAAATRLVVDTNGSVGIGTGSPAVPLHVDGGTDASLSGGGYIVAGAINGLNVVIDNNEIMARSNGVAANLSLNYDAPNRDDSPTDSPVITVSGDGLAPRHDNYTRCGYLGGQAWAGVNAYSFNNASDARLKDNIQPTHYGLQTVLSLRPVSYQWKKKTDGRMNLGLIAQEVEPIVPEAVVKGENPEHTLGLSYNSFIPILIKAVQEQQSLIDAQHVENAELKRRLDKLELLVSARNGGAK